MPLSLIAIVAFQGSTPIRDVRNGLERRYRVKIEQEQGDEFAYRLRLKVIGAKELAGKTIDPQLNMKLTDYRATVGGQTVSAGTMGGGVLELTATGIPGGLDIAGPQGPIWLPLIALYLPESTDDGEFLVGKTEMKSGLSFAGKGTVSHKDRKLNVSLDVAVARGDKELGKLTVETKIDGNGWPTRSEGKLVSADGTYRFTLEKG